MARRFVEQLPLFNVIFDIAFFFFLGSRAEKVREGNI